MPAEAGLAATEDTPGGRSFPVAGAGVPGAARGSSGRHNSSSQQQQRGIAAASSVSFGRVSLLQEMRALQEKLEADIQYLEGKIHEMESDYLAAPAEVGNMIKGWEGYVSTGTKARRLPTKAGGPASGAGERLFSLTSCTSQAWKELGPWTEDDVVQPAPTPVSSSSWGSSSASSAVSHASGSSQRHGGGGGSSVVRTTKRSHAKSTSHGGASSRKSTAKSHAASGETKGEGRGDTIEEHGKSERTTGGTVSDNRCV